MNASVVPRNNERMTAPSPSPERSRELELLRRRAYGPDADIVLDPAAQRRLRELEDLARHVGATDDDPVDARPPGADDAKVDRGRVGVSERGRQDGGRVEYPPARDRRSGWRRMPLWAMTAVVGVVVGVVVGLLWPTGSAPPPDLTLGVDASGGAPGSPRT